MRNLCPGTWARKRALTVREYQETWINSLERMKDALSLKGKLTIPAAGNQLLLQQAQDSGEAWFK